MFFISLSGNEERAWQTAIKTIRCKSISDKFSILNVGAGGGHSFLKEFADVTSVDLSFQSLLNAQSVSNTCYQADACQLPFEDQSFDLVFSAHVLGHIPLDKKQKAIEEIWNGKEARDWRERIDKIARCRDCIEPGAVRYSACAEGLSYLGFLRDLGTSRYLESLSGEGFIKYFKE